MDEARALLDGYVPPHDNLPATIGRPTIYNEEIAAKILEAIASGMKMREVAKLPGFPGKSTVFLWKATNEEFRIAYEAAMEWRAEEDADWLMELATDSSEDYKLEDTGGEGSVPHKVLDKTAIGRSELACKYLWKLMESRAPKKYRPPVEPVIMPPALPGQSQLGDNARLIGHGQTIEADPMQDQINAWRQARTG